jgi:hypothetical protein
LGGRNPLGLIKNSCAKHAIAKHCAEKPDGAGVADELLLQVWLIERTQEATRSTCAAIFRALNATVLSALQLSSEQVYGDAARQICNREE